MKKYRGYYIDHVVFHSESDIDNHIKEQAVSRYKMMCQKFANDGTMELSVLMSNHADYMHKSCGMSYEEIEEIEIEAFQAA